MKLINDIFLKLSIDLPCTNITVLPLNFDEVCQLTSDYKSETNASKDKYAEFVFDKGLGNLNRSNVTQYCGCRSQGLVIPSVENHTWTVMISESSSGMASFYLNQVTWRKRDGTWCLGITLPDVLITDKNYFISMAYMKCYPHSQTGRIMRHERHVRVMREDTGKLKFFQQGEALPFEDQNQYKLKKLTDRVTEAYLLECAKRLGIDLLNEIKQIKPDKCYSFASLKL
jgi:hypothetical protein